MQNITAKTGFAIKVSIKNPLQWLLFRCMPPVVKEGQIPVLNVGQPGDLTMDRNILGLLWDSLFQVIPYLSLHTFPVVSLLLYKKKSSKCLQNYCSSVCQWENGVFSVCSMWFSRTTGNLSTSLHPTQKAVGLLVSFVLCRNTVRAHHLSRPRLSLFVVTMF